jgi:hypothetical protein
VHGIVTNVDLTGRSVSVGHVSIDLNAQF